MDDEVRAHIDAIDPVHRPLFDRIERLVLAEVPDADTVLSYGMPTFMAGRHRFYVGVWQHGVSFYGLQAGQDDGFVERHQDLVSGKSTIRLRPADLDAIDDTELRGLIRAVFSS